MKLQRGKNTKNNKRVNCSTASEFFHLRKHLCSSKDCNLVFSLSVSVLKFSSWISRYESRLFSVEEIKKKSFKTFVLVHKLFLP